MELGIPYELVGPDGTRIVFGNSDAAKVDPDYVGWVDPEVGVTGLDSPEVRESAQDTPQANGGIHFDFFHGRRPITAPIIIDPNVDVGTQIARAQKIKRATNAMSFDATLRWQNTGYAMRRLALRRTAPTRVTGRRPKVAAIAMTCEDYRLVADVETVSAAIAANTPTVIANAGDELARPRFELTGPAPSPVLIDTGLGIHLKAGVSIAAGALLVVDLTGRYPIVEINGVDHYGDVDFLPSAWWGLIPGPQHVRWTGGAGATGSMVVRARDAWI
jgi:hypothetical protein